MKFLFLMDPLETVIYEKDTTFMLMLGAYHKGHEVYYVPKNGISFNNGIVTFNTLSVKPQANSQQPFIIQGPVTLTQHDIQAVFIRPDPPFDEQYLMNTWLLSLLPKNIIVINSPEGIRTVNEKIWAAQFTNLIPPTLVTSGKNDLLDFIRAHHDVIVKPTNAYGGQGVFHIKDNDSNTNVILETLTQRFTKAIICQRYIPEAAQGDKRILLLNGEFLGLLLRVHGDGEHRNNFFAGGKPALATLTARDQEIINTLKPHLQSLGLYFVGIDILGDYLIEVNVTSPTCLQEINRLNNVHLEEKVIDFVTKLVK